MAERKTLLVIGAGASKEAGLPTGQDLKAKIASLLNFRSSHDSNKGTGDPIIGEAIKLAAQYSQGKMTVQHYKIAARQIRDAMPQALSIDNFIDAHSGDKAIERCGKLAITKSILEAERNSGIFVDRYTAPHPARFDFKSIEKTWFNRFTQLLTENCKKEDLAERFSGLTLVIFNYDRCVEHFLFHALQNYYSINQQEAVDLVSKIEIFHPYGKVGDLSWQNKSQSVEFGEQANPGRLLSISDQIRTFTEGTDPESSEIENIRERVATSETLLFLGFAFHPLNMEVLKADAAGEVMQTYFATAYDISDFNCDYIENDLKGLTHNTGGDVFVRNDLKCSELFTEYSRGFSLS